MFRPWSILAFLVPLLIGNAQSQTTKSAGGTVQNKPGIVLVKPQPWAKDSEATVVEFQSYTNRTGYYEFVTKSGAKRQVPTAKVVKVVEYASPEQIEEMTTAEERQKVVTAITEYKDVVAKFPSTRTYVEPSQKILEAEIAKFDGGQLKTKGAWVDKDAYQKEQSVNIITLLKSDVTQAKPPSRFDLKNDPKYIALKELSSSNAAVKADLQTITDLHDKLVRGEKRQELMATLANPALDFAAANAAVTQLKGLKPEEEPATEALVKSWTTASGTVKETEVLAKELGGKMETELAAVQVEDAPPKLSPELDEKVTSLGRTMTVFMAAKPAPQLVTEAREAMAVAEAGKAFNALRPLFAEKQFLKAKDTLDHAGRQAQFVGRETERVMAGLQRYVAGRIEEFSRLREEGKLLAGSNKPAEALAKYEAAFAVIPDSEVGAEIEKLKAATAPQ